jgi:hypothetical protein
MLTAATSPIALTPLLGMPARLRISRCAGAEVATTNPPMTTNTICIVKVIRLQKPSPNARLMARGVAPLTRAASETTTTAMATKMKASGNQRSAHAVKPIAMRTKAPSCAGSCSAPGRALTSAAMLTSPAYDTASRSFLRLYQSAPGAATPRCLPLL